jgi:Coenzyme PQQ synthesis protein D (PqqD)
MLNPNECLEVNTARAAGDVIDGEAIVINLVTGAYYSMQGIGGAVWSMIDERRTVGAMLDAIVAAYDVARDEAARDLDAVLGQLLDEELCRTGNPACPPAGQAGLPVLHKKPYVRPHLQIFRDMEELLALDPPAPGMSQIAWK